MTLQMLMGTIVYQGELVQQTLTPVIIKDDQEGTQVINRLYESAQSDTRRPDMERLKQVYWRNKWVDPQFAKWRRARMLDGMAWETSSRADIRSAFCQYLADTHEEFA